MILSKSRRGFTLLEVLLAAAIFGLSGYLIALSFNNGQMALLNWEERSETEKVYDWAIQRIDFRKLTIDELEKGGEMTSLEGYQIEWRCEVYPTSTLDLFIGEIELMIYDSAADVREFNETRLFYHSKWYENDDREKIIEDKEKIFEKIAQQRRFF